MAKGVPLNEIDFAMIDRALMRGMSRSEAAKATGFGFKTVSLVEEAEGDWKKYQQLRKRENDKRSDRNEKTQQKDEINASQNLHDIARELKNIKSILLKIAEAWEVKM